MTNAGECNITQNERIELNTIAPGDILRITTGIGESAFRYTFVAETQGAWPRGQLEELRPDGSIVGPFRVALQGSGRWTTRQQNPVQIQDRAFTSYFDSVSRGDCLVVGDPDGYTGERLIFDKPGQQITDVVLEKPEIDDNL